MTQRTLVNATLVVVLALSLNVISTQIHFAASQQADREADAPDQQHRKPNPGELTSALPHGRAHVVR